MNDHGEDEERDLTPEERAALGSSLFGRGLLRIRQRGSDQFWEAQARPSLTFRLLGGLAVYLVVVRSIRVPLLRQVIGVSLAVLSLGLWQAIYAMSVVLLLGVRKRGETDRRAES